MVKFSGKQIMKKNMLTLVTCERLAKFLKTLEVSLTSEEFVTAVLKEEFNLF